MRILSALTLLITLAAPAAAEDRVVLESGVWTFTASNPYADRPDVEIVIGRDAFVTLDGASLPGTVRVVENGILSVRSPSSVQVVAVEDEGRVEAPVRLKVLRLLAQESAVIDGPGIDIELPKLPEREEDWTPEQWEAWALARSTAPPYLIASGDARIVFDQIIGDPIRVQTLMEDRASVTALGHTQWLGLDMRDDATFVGASVWATGTVAGRARFEVTEAAAWGNIQARERAQVRMMRTGDVGTGFSVHLYDEANARIEQAGGGLYQHFGSGMLEMVDSVAPPEAGGIRELRVWMRSPEARVWLRNFGQVHSLNAPVCGMPCNPWYVVFGQAEYLRVDDSLLNFEIDQVRFVELHNSQAPSIYPVSSGGGGYKAPIRGECLLNEASVTSVGFDRQCARLRVSILKADGSRLAGARLTLLDPVSGSEVAAYDVSSGTLAPSRVSDAEGVAVFDLAPRATPLRLRIEAPGVDRTQDVVLVRDAEELTIRV